MLVLGGNVRTEGEFGTPVNATNSPCTVVVIVIGYKPSQQIDATRRDAVRPVWLWPVCPDISQ